MQKVIAALILTVCIPVYAQTITVKKENARIKGANVPGYETELEGNVEEVTAALTKYLKVFAKLKPGNNPISTSEIVISNISYKNPVYAMVRERGNRAAAWMGIKPEEWPSADEAEKVQSELERLTRDFAVTFYRDRIQAQIDESERALQAVERQQQRLVNENKNLNLRLENNQKEKTQLEKSLEANKLEYLNLQTRLEQNKKSQDSLAVVLEQVKKVLEMHRERKQKVN
ncbi:MAG: hypothetical protein NZM13_02135 [Cyclobacteriaceae bacterium]|nr:hypothetical protein [Cyclobacteriaceae bacterium]